VKVPEILINLFPSSKVAFKVPITVKFPGKGLQPTGGGNITPQKTMYFDFKI
jgi:hypothetical protein